MFLNIMFRAMMRRFQLKQNFELSCWNFQGLVTVDVPIPNMTCRICCNINQRPTGMNTPIEWANGEY